MGDKCLQCPLKRVDWCLDDNSTYKHIICLLNSFIDNNQIYSYQTIDINNSTERLNELDKTILAMIETLKKLVDPPRQ